MAGQEDAQKALQSLTEDYQKIQEGWCNAPVLDFSLTDMKIFRPLSDLQSQILARQKLESQQSENTAVQSEFKTLSSDSQIYKLIGPVLLKQEKSDAVMSVEGRLEYIGKEIKRVEGQIAELQEKGEMVRGEVLRAQGQLQGQGGGQAGGG